MDPLAPLAPLPSAPSPLADLLPELEHARRFAAATSAPATPRVRSRVELLRGLVLVQALRRIAGTTGMPATLAAYISALAVGATMLPDGRPRAPRKAAGIDLALAAITAAHRAAGLDSPRDAAGGRAVRRGIRRELGTAPREAAPAGRPRWSVAREERPIYLLMRGTPGPDVTHTTGSSTGNRLVFHQVTHPCSSGGIQMIHRSFFVLSLIATLLAVHSPAEAGFCTSYKKCRKQLEKIAQDAGKATVDAGKATVDAGKAVEKAVQDAGKTSEKAAQDAGKTSEKAGRDTWNELTRERKGDENIYMDFSNMSSGPVEGVDYRLVYENGKCQRE